VKSLGTTKKPHHLIGFFVNQKTPALADSFYVFRKF